MPAMALRPLLRQLATNQSGVALAREGGRAFVSASLRPYLVAALLDGVDDALAAGRAALVVAGDDRQARDLAADLRPSPPPPATGSPRARSASIRAAASRTSRISPRRRTSSASEWRPSTH